MVKTRFGTGSSHEDRRTDGQTDRIPIANTRSQQYLPVQLSHVKIEGAQQVHDIVTCDDVVQLAVTCCRTSPQHVVTQSRLLSS